MKEELRAIVGELVEIIVKLELLATKLEKAATEEGKG